MLMRHQHKNRESVMAKIRHLAMIAKDPQKLADFYCNVFEMKVVRTSKSGAVYVTDGYLNLAILKNKGDKPDGLHHFGFQVDDMGKTGDLLAGAGVERPQVRPNNPPYAETRSRDPEGNLFDLSVHGYQSPEFAEDRAAKPTKKVSEKV
jgi:catechol 2,3-dioxygenase-like lactoylglutathione lyase family enzyme